MYEYNEEEVERFGREGGKFLLENGVIDTADLEEVRRFKRGIEEEEIEKTEGRRSFNIIKIRGDNKMENEFGDSAYNEDLELEDLMEKFDEEEIDDDILKEIKVIPQKLREALKECYKILNEYKEDIKDLSPELFSVIGTLGKLASSSGKKYPYPEKYPYPKKVKKSMDWQGVQDMLFGGHIPADDEEIEKSSKENPFPSITRALKIKKEAIDEVEDEMEQDSFDPYDRMA